MSDAQTTSGWSEAQVVAALTSARDKMEQMRNRLSEPLAIIGLGCRFPQASQPEAFWQLLEGGRCAVTETPGDRWERALTATADKQPGRITANRGGFLEQVDLFDAGFFGLTRREAESIDPQQRLLLEVTWETLEHAGLDPNRLRGSRTGVFIGICSNDYLHLLAQRDRAAIDAYLGTGNAHGPAAGRISYFMHWTGPSVAVDTACSSSLTALHLAARSLRAEDCDLALVGGVNVMLTPELSINLSQAGMLSPTGLCHAFDAAADGFVRGEGCGAILLKRLSRAQQDGDRVFCVLRGSALNQDGHSNGLTAPSGVAQQAVLRAALRDAGCTPEQVDYIEAHGTGTELGDPIEMSALASVFATGRQSAPPLRVGSVKTNIGHLEGAAGIAGVIKVALALQQGRLPGHPHFQNPSPHIDWDIPIEVPRQTTPWPAGDRPRIAGVSSFGFSGTNAHVVLQEAPRVDGETGTPQVASGQTYLLTLSAHSSDALRQQAVRYAESLDGDLSLSEICYTANTGRAHFDHRLAVRFRSRDELRETLRRFAAENTETNGQVNALANLRVGKRGKEPVVHWLCGDRAGWDHEAGRFLYQTHPEFRRQLDECGRALAECWPRSLTEILWSDASLRQGPDGLPALFCLQVAAARWWQSLGLVPTTIVGHKEGEYAAACIAGFFSFADGLKLVTRLATQASTNGDARPTLPDASHPLALEHPQFPYVSTRSGPGRVSDMTCSYYWTGLAAATTDVAAALEPLADALLLELGPRTQIAGGRRLHVLSGLSGREDEWEIVQASLADLYGAGAGIDWRAVHPSRCRRVRLPSYPFERQRYWFDESSVPARHQLAGSAGRQVHPLLVQLDLAGEESIFEADPSRHLYLADHCLGATVVFPAAGYLEGAWAAGKVVGNEALQVADLNIERPLTWNPREACRVQIVLRPEGTGFTCRFVKRERDRWQQLATCRLTAEASRRGPSRMELPAQAGTEIATEEHYRACGAAGLNYGPSFRGLRRLFSAGNESWGEVALPKGLRTTGYTFHPALLDACLQTMTGVLVDQQHTAWLPYRLDAFRIYGDPPQDGRFRVYAQRHPQAEGTDLRVSLWIADRQGQVIAEIDRLGLKPTRREAPPANSDAATSDAATSDAANSDAGGSDVTRAILQAPESQRIGLLCEQLHARLSDIMGMSVDEIPVDRPLNRLGLDSLMALELRDEIELGFQLNLPMELFLQERTLTDFATILLDKLQAGAGGGDRDVTSQAGTPKEAVEESWIEGAI